MNNQTPKRRLPRQPYADRHITLPPADDAAVVAHAEQNGIAYSTAIAQLLQHNGRVMGASAGEARRWLRELRSKIESSIESAKRGEAGSNVPLREMNDLVGMALAALG
jgi:hypothetical protein